jgi:cell division protein ZapE
MPNRSKTAVPPPGPLAEWRRRIEAGALRADPAQQHAVEALQALHDALEKRRRALARAPKGLLEKLGIGRQPVPAAPAGVYLWGGVGRGKSMLMDLFFETATTAPKRRVHFNAFMLEIHRRIHAWRQTPESKAGRDADPIPPLADAVAAEAALLCFDEFHVVDIADAMILARLFTALLDRGTTIVATSNWPPRRLYEGGLQRDRFLPFIALVEARMVVVEVAGGRDYRQDRLRGMPVWYTPLGPRSTAALASIFDRLTDGATPAPVTLAVPGKRTLTVPQAARRVALVAFEDLCARPLGAADYLTLADAFDTVLIDGVPRFTEARRNEMKRFIVLIDSLYEARRRIVVAAETSPGRLYAADSAALEFARTESRLMEMQSAEWLGLADAEAA